MLHHFARSSVAAASILQMAMPAVGSAVQGFGRRSSAADEYQITVVHDRLTDSTRVEASFTGSSRPFGLSSQAWLGVSFSFPGTQLSVPPPSVTLTIEGWTWSRGGWAFVHPQWLRVRSGDSLFLEFPPAGYVRHRVHLFDKGLGESLWYDIPSPAFARLARAPELVFTAGRARFRVRERMEMLRQVARQMTPPVRGSR